MKILSMERKSVLLHVHILILIVVKMNLVTPATPTKVVPVSIVASVLLRPITAVLTPTALILMAPSNVLATKALNGSMKMIIPRAAKISMNAILLEIVSLSIDVVMHHVSTKTVAIRVSATIPVDILKLLTISLVLFHVMISMYVKKMWLFVTIMLSAITLMDHTTVSVEKATLSTLLVNMLVINSLRLSVSISTNATKPIKCTCGKGFQNVGTGQTFGHGPSGCENLDECEAELESGMFRSFRKHFARSGQAICSENLHCIDNSHLDDSSGLNSSGISMGFDKMRMMIFVLMLLEMSTNVPALSGDDAIQYNCHEHAVFTNHTPTDDSPNNFFSCA